MSQTIKVLMIDNYDSFTFNLVQYLGELGAEVDVQRNDDIDLDYVENSDATHIMISPGPCTPNEAGISMQVIEAMSGKKPILGVCLGHQSIAQVFGGDVIHAKQIMHGKTSMIYHTNEGVFAGLTNPYEATRYHSLVVDQSTMPKQLKVTAWTQDDNGDIDEIMGVKHNDVTVEGVQFHPESILTEHGHDLLRNFLQQEQ